MAARPIEAVELGRLPLDRSRGGGDRRARSPGLLLAAGDGIAFRHALLRDAVYEEIAEPRRRGLHHRWAQALLACERAGAIPRPAEVARHLRLAGADAEAVPQLVRAAAEARAVAALEQAIAYLDEALAIAPRSRRACGSRSASSRRGGAAAIRRRPRSAERWRCSRGRDPLVLARAWLRQARATHGPICVPRDRARERPHRARADRPERTGRPPHERSEALAAWAWAEAVAGSVEEAERLLLELSAEPDRGDDLHIYDVGHARALALMRRGRFVESYGPSIAAGEAIGAPTGPIWRTGAGRTPPAPPAPPASTSARSNSSTAGWRRSPATACRPSRFICSPSDRSCCAGSDRLAEAHAAAEAEQALADRLGRAGAGARWRATIAAWSRSSRASTRLAAALLAESLVEGAPISRPATRLALAEALARGGHPERAAEQVRATVLEPVRPSDFPDTLVPRLARVQGLLARAREDYEEAERRLEESIAGWERVLARSIRAESITTVLADLGRPVVGLVEPERELARARADLQSVRSREGATDAVVP